jgi:hypothetical protein
VRDDVKKSFEDFLNPDIMRFRLVAASVYIAAYESLLMAAIKERPREMYNTGWSEKEGFIVGREYKEKVLSRNTSELYASFDWLREHGAVSYADLAVLDRVKTCRNHLAHRLLQFLGKEGLPPNFEQCFGEMAGLLHKIEKWWIVEVELPCSGDFRPEDIEYDGIVPGRVMTLRLMCDIALGDEDARKYYYEEFKKR